MENRLAKFFLYLSSWIGIYVIINLIFLLLNYLTRTKSVNDSYEFYAGIFAVNGRFMGLSVMNYVYLTILILLLYFGYRYLNRSKKQNN